MTARELDSGKILYYYQAGGKKIPLGSNRVTANEEWTRLEADGVGARRFPQVSADYRKATFPSFSLSTRSHYNRALDNLDLAFRKFTLEQIEPRHIKDYIRRRSKKPSAMFEKRVGAAFFNWAREEGHTRAASPFRGVTFSRAERRGFQVIGRRNVYVTDEQYREVWRKGDAVLQDTMDIALYSGQRPGDVLKARRQDIVEGVLVFVQEKTGAKVGVKLQGDLKRVVERALARERNAPSMYLIADRHGQRVRYNALNDRFRKARGEATWQFRDIRAKTASDLPNLKKAQLLLGHANETTTNVYRRPTSDTVAPLERKI